jgi:hypothetical protein
MCRRVVKEHNQNTNNSNNNNSGQVSIIKIKDCIRIDKKTMKSTIRTPTIQTTITADKLV